MQIVIKQGTADRWKYCRLFFLKEMHECAQQHRLWKADKTAGHAELVLVHSKNGEQHV